VDVLRVFFSAFFAILPAMFCTIIPSIPILAIFDAIWQEKERLVYADHAGEIFTADMAKAEMSAKYPSLYKLRFVYNGIIIVSILGIIWLISFAIIYSLITYIPIFIRF
jgi:hypothetical protein